MSRVAFDDLPKVKARKWLRLQRGFLSKERAVAFRKYMVENGLAKRVKIRKETRWYFEWVTK